MLWIIPAAAAFLALAAIVVGLAIALRANKELQSGLERVRTAQQRIDPSAFQPALDRISADADAAKSLSSRAAAAVAEIRSGLQTLRLREAMMALRVASVAVRALLLPH